MLKLHRTRMGKIFPYVTTLKEKPGLLEKTLTLIENSFHYSPPNSFKIDFLPLIDESNYHNCFILVDENENVLAHVGVKERTIILGTHNYPVSLIGGIAVDEKHRGEGNFQKLMLEVLSEKRSDNAFFLLWSDLKKLYNKFGFFLCGNQFELLEIKGSSEFEKTKFEKLTDEEKKDIQRLFDSSFSSHYVTLSRSQKDWDLLFKISSADLFIKRKDKRICDYFLMNKGQDLTGIIYEYGSGGSITGLLEQLTRTGRVWMGSPFIDTDQIQYQFFMSPADKRLFASFVEDYTDGKFRIKEINAVKQEVFFEFNEETLVLGTEEFLQGVFGPGVFEELGEISSLFISGIDSV